MATAAACSGQGDSTQDDTEREPLIPPTDTRRGWFSCCCCGKPNNEDDNEVSITDDEQEYHNFTENRTDDRPTVHAQNTSSSNKSRRANGSGTLSPAGPNQQPKANHGSVSGVVSPTLHRDYLKDDDPLGEAVGRIQFGVRYDDNRRELIVKIIRATHLIPKIPGGTCDPYVKVVLLPNKKNKICTKLRRRTLDPEWEEFLAFEDVSLDSLQKCTLFLQVLEHDKFSKHEPLGEAYVTLSDLDLPAGQVLWWNLLPSKRTGNLGKLYLYLCYNARTSELRITVDRAMHLKAQDQESLPDTYVKVSLMYDGQRVEKKKTPIIANNLNPKYNKILNFNVPLERIRSTSLVISVMNYDQFGRNEIIGQILLGNNSGTKEVKHWHEMLSKARQDIGQWHVLKNLS